MFVSETSSFEIDAETVVIVPLEDTSPAICNFAWGEAVPIPILPGFVASKNNRQCEVPNPKKGPHVGY